MTVDHQHDERSPVASTDEQLNEIEKLAAHYARRTNGDYYRLVGMHIPELIADVKKLRGAYTAALDHIRRIENQRDAAARAIRSPHLTDAERIAEVREALAVAEGLREAGEPR